MYRYIIVDDEPIIRKGLQVRLEAFETRLCCVGEADNGHLGLELARKTAPHIVFADMKMPEHNGIEFLKALTLNMPWIKIIVISGYKDFEYMNAAIDSSVCGYILKPFDSADVGKAINKAILSIEQEAETHRRVVDMENQIRQIQGKINGQLLFSFIAEGRPETDELEQNLPSGLLKPGMAFQLMLLHIPNTLMSGTLRRIVYQHTEYKKQIFIEGPPDSGCNLILFYFDADQAQQIQRRLSYFARLLLADIDDDLPTYIGVSAVHPSFRELPEAYREALAAEGQRRVRDGRAVCLYRPGGGTGKSTALLETSSNLFNVLRSADYAQIRGWFHTAFSGIEEERGLTFAGLKELCGALEKEIDRLLTLLDVPVKVDFISDFDAKFRFIRAIEPVEEEFAERTSRMIHVKQTLSSGNDSQVAKIEEFIQKNYGQKLSLEMIAARFFMSMSYCSYIFKAKTGCKLTDYIAQVRIEAAKRLLRDTDMEIEAVSRASGYKNAKYFFTIFKKYAGCTPLEYRNGH